MGCKKATKGAFKWFWGWMKPEVVRVGVDLVTALEPMTDMEGSLKERIAMSGVKEKARSAGQELTTSAAKTLINGIHTMLINNQPVDELGQPDDDGTADPE